MSDQELKQTIKRLEECLSSFVNGDPEPYKAFWSHGADVTIFGAWGAYAVGWEVVRPRLAWAAARFTGGRTTYEPLALSSFDQDGRSRGAGSPRASSEHGVPPVPLLRGQSYPGTSQTTRVTGGGDGGTAGSSSTILSATRSESAETVSDGLTPRAVGTIAASAT